MKNKARVLLLLFGDIVALFGAFFVMLALAFPGPISREEINSHFVPFLSVFFIWLIIFFLFRLYEAGSTKPTIPNLRKIGIASLTALLISIIPFYIIPFFGITPKTNLVIFSFIFSFFFLVWRRIFFKIFSTYFRKSVAFVINPEKDKACAGAIVDYIENYPQSGFFLVDEYSSLEEFLDKSENAPVDTLIISKNAIREGQDTEPVYGIVENISDLAQAYENILYKIPVDIIDETWFLQNIAWENRIFYDIAIYLLNVIFVIIILPVALILLILAAIFIKLEDGGPVFYLQTRVGKYGIPFTFYKLRSMVVDADKNGAEWTEKNDKRITKVGKIIRRLHIDEIPQFLNILKGDMVLVGPRPEIPSFENKLKREIPHYGLRQVVTPGWTGWAQIKWRNARGVAESKEKFEYDLYYIKNKNIFMDLGIILRTISLVIIFTHDS